MSGSSGQAGGSTAPFANVVNSNIGAESAIASGVGSLNTNPASQYGNYANTYGPNLGSAGNAAAVTQAPAALASGQSTSDTYSAYGPEAIAQGNQAYNTYSPYAQAALTQGTNTSNTNNAYANSALATGFNNNNALYTQMYQQNQDQANAENAMAGVASTPYGAALANQSGQNFNNQWQSYLTGLENTASGTASNLQNAGQNALNSGYNNSATAQGLAQSGLNSGYSNAATTQGLAQTGLNSGYSNYGNLLGTGASTIGSGLSTGQNVDTQQYNAQQGSISDLLSLLSTYSGAQNQTLSGALSQAGLNNTGAQQSNANTTSELSGLGSLAASLAKLGISTGAL